jgi:uncharacterized protein (DUF302 family)
MTTCCQSSSFRDDVRNSTITISDNSAVVAYVQDEERRGRSMRTETYGFSVAAGKDFDRALDTVVQELKKEGFGIVTDINFQTILKDKLAVDEMRYRILGACDPSLAYQAIRADPDIGLLLPCNIVVREDREGNVTVAFTAPEALLGLVNRDDITKLGMHVRRRFERVRDVLVAKTRRAA